MPAHRVEGQAGDCVLFTEKLSHGTVPWTGSGERRTLFCAPTNHLLSFAPRATAAFWDLTLLRTSDKYVPYGMHHSDVGYDTTDPELTSQQRDILEFSGSWFNLPTQPNRHECADQNPIAKRVLARRCQAPSQAAACGGRPGANVEYGATNPALTQLHPLATTPVDSASVDMVPGWAGPRDNVHGAR